MDLLTANSQPAAMPDWLSTELTVSPQPLPSKRKRSSKVIPKGRRNDQLFREAAALRERGLSEAAIFEALKRLNEERCEPPLPIDELREIAHSAAKYVPQSGAQPTDGKNTLWWFRLDVNQWCTDGRILFLSDYQVGWLIWLRVMAWTRRGYLPNDPQQLAVLARASNPKRFIREMAAVMVFFDVTEDETLIFDPELVEYWTSKVEQVEKNRQAGLKSAESRRKKAQQSETEADEKGNS